METTNRKKLKTEEAKAWEELRKAEEIRKAKEEKAQWETDEREKAAHEKQELLDNQKAMEESRLAIQTEFKGSFLSNIRNLTPCTGATFAYSSDKDDYEEMLNLEAKSVDLQTEETLLAKQVGEDDTSEKQEEDDMAEDTEETQ